jgi:hypothetical protein
MEQHQFSCSVDSFDSFEQLTNKMPNWGYAAQHIPANVTNISVMECKSTKGVVTFILANNEMILMKGPPTHHP